jgi:CheY-like chemotaxis protein
MKVQFPIIWVDDNREFMDSLIDSIQDHLSEHGFGLQMNFYESREENLFQRLSTKDVELVVVDYNLSDEKGDALIQEIRRRGNYQEILFYTQSGLPSSVRQLGLEGVFYTNRAGALERILKIIDWKVKRLSDLTTMRGWIVADAIELEAMIVEIVVWYFEGSGSKFEKYVLDKGRLREFADRYALLNSLLSEEIEELNKAAQNSSRAIALRNCKQVLSTFVEDVIEIRNAVAHQRATEGVSGQISIKTIAPKMQREILVNEETCMQFRLSLLKHYRNLSELREMLLGSSPPRRS